MRKPIVIMFCVFTLTSASLSRLIIKEFFTPNKFPDIVATVEEHNAIKNESVVTNLVGLVEQYDGYKAIQYDIMTDDGYILGLQRIYVSPKSPQSVGKPAVLLQHGVFESATDFVILGPKSLAFVLADAGYDVYLGNIRGNMYSRRHNKYTTKDAEFWDFRMDEVGLYDTSKMIDVALEKSGQTKLTYIGYSMGASLSSILLSERPEYNDKINFMIFLAPVVYFTKPIDIVTKALFTVTSFAASIFHWHEVVPPSVKLIEFAKEFCSKKYINICALVFSPLKNIRTADNTKFPFILSYFPSGTSYGIVEHFRQITSNGTLRKYDYPCDLFHRSCKNKVIHNQKEPPIYDLSRIKVATAVFYGKHDNFVRATDSQKLRYALPNVVFLKQVPENQFHHLDFVFAENAVSLVYNDIVKVIHQFSMTNA